MRRINMLCLCHFVLTSSYRYFEVLHTLDFYGTSYMLETPARLFLSANLWSNRADYYLSNAC